ncbi:MAG: alpha/beta fold hydrolase [Patescibacteria group bacterium]|jgi:pimeloyl-ACP methyl ester carboxylesterase
MFTFSQGLKIYYHLTEANPCKGICIFLHGLGGDGGIWEFMEKPVVSKGYSFIAVDLPGHGLSERLNKFTTVRDLADAVKTVIDVKRLKKITLVGHCFGGMVALETDLCFPKNINQLALINTSPAAPSWGKWFSKVLSWRQPKLISPKYAHVDFSYYRGTGDLNLFRLASDLSHVGSCSYSFLLHSALSWKSQSKLKTLKVPTLIIGGKKDVIFPPKTQEYLATLLPNSKLLLLEENHLIPLNAPEQLREILVEYI